VGYLIANLAAVRRVESILEVPAICASIKKWLPKSLADWERKNAKTA
jgi:hypothetical protein